MSKKECGNCIHYDACKKISDVHGLAFGSSPFCEHYKSKSLFVELPCEWGKDLYVIAKDCKEPVKTKLLAIGIDEDGDIVYNPNEYPKGVFGIGGAEIGKNLFTDPKKAEKKLKEMG